MNSRFRVLWWVAACVLSAGCTLTPIPLPITPSSYWGDIFTVGQAEQPNAPAFLVTAEHIVTAWVGADNTGIHQDMRLVSNGATLTTVLPLPPERPYAQQLAPAQDGSIHLLWLDADENGETRLFCALITSEQTIERGPTLISDRPTLRYVVMSNGDGSLWAIWSGAPIDEPVLYAQYIDSLGRPRQAVRLVEDADWPALTYTGSGVYLYWIQTTTGSIFRARLINGVLNSVETISPGIVLSAADRLTSFSAASDHTNGYLFWNLTRADGQPETWFSTSLLETPIWREPSRLGVDWTTKEVIETGFNGGRAYPAHLGDRWLSWVVPVAGQLETLPVTAVQKDKLALIYFRGGEVIGYQSIVATPGLIGLPALMTDRNLHLYLAWSQPTAEGYADLKLTTTRR
jgi:hypothetical protein